MIGWMWKSLVTVKALGPQQRVAIDVDSIEYYEKVTVWMEIESLAIDNHRHAYGRCETTMRSCNASNAALACMSMTRIKLIQNQGRVRRPDLDGRVSFHTQVS